MLLDLITKYWGHSRESSHACGLICQDMSKQSIENASVFGNLPPIIQPNFKARLAIRGRLPPKFWPTLMLTAIPIPNEHYEKRKRKKLLQNCSIMLLSFLIFALSTLLCYNHLINVLRDNVFSQKLSLIHYILGAVLLFNSSTSLKLLCIVSLFFM